MQIVMLSVAISISIHRHSGSFCRYINNFRLRKRTTNGAWRRSRAPIRGSSRLKVRSASRPPRETSNPEPPQPGGPCPIPSAETNDSILSRVSSALYRWMSSNTLAPRPVSISASFFPMTAPPSLLHAILMVLVASLRLLNEPVIEQRLAHTAFATSAKGD